MNHANIASHLPDMAKQQPNTPAVIMAKDGKQFTYMALDVMSNDVARGLKANGVRKGMRVVVMVQPGLNFYALVFALFKIGAVLVAVDPGIGLKNLKECLDEALPDVFIGNNKAHFARLLFSWGKQTLRRHIIVRGNFLFKRIITPLEDVVKEGRKTTRDITTDTKANDLAAILFTSGSTGVPKGVMYSHANFTAQVETLKQLYQIDPGEVDLATFPLFGLFAPAMGMTAVIPDMDFTRPGSVEPKNIIEPLKQYNCTTMFGSPALLKQISMEAKQNKDAFKKLNRILSAGAPVPSKVLNDIDEVLVSGVQVYTPYGATESLPVSSIGSKEILTETSEDTAKGKGVCVGKPVLNLDVKIIKITDEVIKHWQDVEELGVNEVGEIVVKGPQVTASYFHRERATELAKIYSDDGFYHRMGDTAYFDDKGRLWFCGRKSQRVDLRNRMMHTVCCEGVFDAHPAVFRSALVGVKDKHDTYPVICIEIEKEYKALDKAELEKELLEKAATNEVTENIQHILFHDSFPVDIRHNAKIGREKLAVWASKQLA